MTIERFNEIRQVSYSIGVIKDFLEHTKEEPKGMDEMIQYISNIDFHLSRIGEKSDYSAVIENLFKKVKENLTARLAELEKQFAEMN